MKYFIGAHLIKNEDLFSTYDVKTLTGKGNIKRTYKCADKKELTRRIFLRYLHIMLTDLLQGGKTFIFPTKWYLELKMRRIPHQDFIKARKAGAFEDLDVLMSDRMHYEPILSYKRGGKPYAQVVKLSKNYLDIIIEKVNTGYKYC